MARQPNQFYQNPTAEIGSNLARALFGDPRARAQQQQQQAENDARAAQAEEARAHARLYGAQATGADTANAANVGLPELFANLYKTTPATAPRAPIGNEPDDGGEIPGTPGVSADQAFKSGLPALFAALAQGGHGAEVGNFTQAAAAFGGGDELARRALISDGHVPGKDFSLSPERDDAIAARDSSAKLLEALGVARVNHATDIPVANIRAGASRDVAGINHATDIPVAQIGANSRVDAAGVRGGGNSLGQLVSSLYGITPTSQDRSQAQQDGLIARGATGAVHSYHVPGNGGQAIDLAPIPGKSLAQVVQELRANGADVIEAKDETAPGQGTGPHWHIAVRDTGKQSAWAKAPKPISAASRTVLDAEIDRQIGTELRNKLSTAAITDIRARAATMYQQSGNPSDAVRQAVMQRVAAGHERNQRLAAGNTPVRPAAGSGTPPKPKGNPDYPNAQRGPDGVLYVTKVDKNGRTIYGAVPG